jgi:hypothetical protein
MVAMRWNRRWLLGLVPALALAGMLAGPVQAGYQATVDSNESAFRPPCLGVLDSLPAKMLAAAKAAYVGLGYTTGAYTTTSFTRAHTLARTVNDWSYYAHSHGDYYWHAADGRRYTGFREDSGDCSQAVVYSKDIAAKRAGRATNLVVMSMCHNADANTTMPGAFGIAKSKATGSAWNGPEFFLGYLGTAYDNDEWVFEQRFWDAIDRGHNVGQAFDIANLGNFTHSDFAADWWGSYNWYGLPGPYTGCRTCA